MAGILLGWGQRGGQEEATYDGAGAWEAAACEVV